MKSFSRRVVRGERVKSKFAKVFGGSGYPSSGVTKKSKSGRFV